MNVIRKLRIESGMTQRQFAEAIGVSTTTVSVWETKAVVFKKKHREAISKEFNVPEAEVFCSSDNVENLLTFVPETKWDKATFLERLKRKWGV